MNPSVLLLDQTLREGEQQAGIRFTAEQKIEIVRLLEEFGVDTVEVGHPAISPEDEQICTEAARAAQRVNILMHARAVVDEVQVVKRAGANWVGIWASCNEVALNAKFPCRTLADIEDKVKSAITAAKSLGLKVRFTIEDASRTSCLRRLDIARVALSTGADRISLADTTGVWEPRQCAEAVEYAIKTLNCPIEVHLHNDLGLAQANALAAIDAGASVVDVSILGIGERCGITDAIQLAVALRRLRNDSRFNLDRIPDLTRAVQTWTGYRPDALRPVVGRNAFTHASAYHVSAVQRDPEAYEAFQPELVGRWRTVKENRCAIDRSVPVAALEIGKPFVKGASELKYHRDGPGVRWVLMDSRVDPRSSFYVIQRFIGLHGTPIVPENHVDTHAHHCDSAFVFWGDQPDGSGLTCHVQLDKEEKTINSPASVFIPAGLEHSYRYVAGKGTYINIVLSPDYNSSLESRPTAVTAPPQPITNQ